MRPFFHYKEWECFQHGLYNFGISEEIPSKCAGLLSSKDRFDKTLAEVIPRWEKTCKQHLMDTSINRRAFLGRIACCYLFGANEDEVRVGWGMISSQSKVVANKVATKHIRAYQSLVSPQITIFDA